eukprot:CAMPEP_0172475834 /NCGR_PEP_ID=MMETSP1065-20121228/70073_1 /TAXON_ID=265537 /ORGANISM="Amphiprora paludosa, Strain CCMP125" /LENGTH=341 /DNA_ID=CAMNT_0013234049 /DNA_START=65 /DNA_END=1090 /DNA_ORIENTATION=+
MKILLLDRKMSVGLSIWLSFFVSGRLAFAPQPANFALGKLVATGNDARASVLCRATEEMPISASTRESINWFKSEKVESLLPKEDALAIIDEILSEKSLIDDSEATVMESWDKLRAKLLQEKRTIAEILGKDTMDRVLKSVENVEGYDPAAVRAFLGSEAVNKLLAQVLYDGIYNFFQTIDVFGNIIGNLPIIGPIRNQIRDEAKRSLDRTVGPLIQSFLRSYTKVAVLEASDFVLSPANRKVFGSANVKLVSSILDRPVNSLIPSAELTDKLRVDVYEYFRNVKTEDLEEYVSFYYELAGDKSVDDYVDVNRIIDSSPTLQRTIERLWTKSISAGETGSD